MKKPMFLITTVAAVMVSFLPVSFAGEQVTSLRGAVALDAASVEPTVKPWEPAQKDLIERNFLEQPPLIPHAVEGFIINQDVNTCLTCHSRVNAKNTESPAPRESHFKDRDGNALQTVSSSRYFCNQCHVRQVVAEPLVGNTYLPATGE
jgi:cytochrome c-type protein NapB